MIVDVSDQPLIRFKQQLLPEIKLETINDQGKRYYITPEGNKYRSVTTALSSINAKQIAEWRAKVGEEQATKISTAASTRGTKLHKICEDYVIGNELKISPIQMMMFEPIKNYLDEHLDLVYGVELALYSNTLQLAGRCDLVGRLHGLPCVIDFKTSSRPKKEQWITNYFYQTTAYAQMVSERYNLLCKWLCILIVTPEGDLQVYYRPVKDYYKGLVTFLARDNQG